MTLFSLLLEDYKKNLSSEIQQQLSFHVVQYPHIWLGVFMDWMFVSPLLSPSSLIFNVLKILFSSIVILEGGVFGR